MMRLLRNTVVYILIGLMVISLTSCAGWWLLGGATATAIYVGSSGDKDDDDDDDDDDDSGGSGIGYTVEFTGTPGVQFYGSVVHGGEEWTITELITPCEYCLDGTPIVVNVMKLAHTGKTLLVYIKLDDKIVATGSDNGNWVIINMNYP